MVCQSCVEKWFRARNTLRRSEGLPVQSRATCPVCRQQLRGSSRRCSLSDASTHFWGLPKVTATWEGGEGGEGGAGGEGGEGGEALQVVTLEAQVLDASEVKDEDEASVLQGQRPLAVPPPPPRFLPKVEARGRKRKAAEADAPRPYKLRGGGTSGGASGGADEASTEGQTRKRKAEAEEDEEEADDGDEDEAEEEEDEAEDTPPKLHWRKRRAMEKEAAAAGIPILPPCPNCSMQFALGSTRSERQRHLTQCAPYAQPTTRTAFSRHGTNARLQRGSMRDDAVFAAIETLAVQERERKRREAAEAAEADEEVEEEEEEEEEAEEDGAEQTATAAPRRRRDFSGCPACLGRHRPHMAGCPGYKIRWPKKKKRG